MGAGRKEGAGMSLPAPFCGPVRGIRGRFGFAAGAAPGHGANRTRPRSNDAWNAAQFYFSTQTAIWHRGIRGRMMGVSPTQVRYSGSEPKLLYKGVSPAGACGPPYYAAGNFCTGIARRLGGKIIRVVVNDNRFPDYLVYGKTVG